MGSEKNPEIEYLRALAVILLVMSHLPELLPFHKAVFTYIHYTYVPWTGVDLFFCISGYVVSKSLVEFLDTHKAEGNFWLAAQCFWIRRMYRLIPSSWTWLFIGILCSVFFNQTGVFNSWWQNLRSASAILTFSGNLANQYNQLLAPNDVYWSLALEEQFYFVFPLFLLVISGAWRWRILLALIAIQFFINRNPFGTPFSAMAWSFRVDPIMWGALIYIFSKSSHFSLFEPTFLKHSRLLALVLNSLLIYLLGAIPAQLITMPMAHGLVSLVAAIFVLMAVYQSNYVLNIPGFSSILTWLGARSYAIYLIHMPVYRMTVEGYSRYALKIGHPFNAFYTLPMILTATLLILLLAELNFRLIENPLRKRGIALSNSRLENWRNQSVGPHEKKLEIPANLKMAASARVQQS